MSRLALIDEIIETFRSHLDAGHPEYQFLGALRQIRAREAQAEEIGASRATVITTTAAVVTPTVVSTLPIAITGGSGEPTDGAAPQPDAIVPSRRAVGRPRPKKATP